MIYREADGGDKIAAFERGLSDEDVHRAFETTGTTAYVVAEQFLVAYRTEGQALIVVAKQRLYGAAGPGWDAVDEFLEQEASAFQCRAIVDRSIA